MFHKNEVSFEGYVKVNHFFHSGFEPKTEIRFVCSNEIKFPDVWFSIDDFRNTLLRSPISSIHAFDEIMPTILRKAALSSPQFTQCDYVTPVHKKGPRAEVENVVLF